MAAGAIIGAVVSEVVSEVLALVIGKAKDKLRAKGIDVDADETTARLFDAEIRLLELSLKGVVDEFAAAEARGKARALGGDAISWEEVTKLSDLPCDLLSGGMCILGRGHDGDCRVRADDE